MIDFLSIKLADFLCKRNIVKEEDKEIYIYGNQLLISSSIGIILTMIIGVIVGKPLITILYLIIFITTRQHCGGYHANHFLTCILSFLATYVLILVADSFLLESDGTFYCILIEFVYLITVIRFAPIEHKNKPLSNSVKQDNRKKSIIYSILWIMISILSYFLCSEVMIIIALTLGAITMFMLIEKSIRR